MGDPPALRDAAAAAALVRLVAAQIRESPASALASAAFGRDPLASDAGAPGEPQAAGDQPIFRTTTV